MIITVWRHGEAGWASSDSQRELTKSGRDDIGFGALQFHAACLARAISHPDLILHSPWLRTNQTAGVLAAAFSHAKLRPERALRPGSSPDAVLAMLQTLQEPAERAPRHLLLVSHQPLVSRLVDRLLGSAGEVPSLPPGGLATLEMHVAAPAGASLRFWAVAPQYEMNI
jgi:phosphohistidine phosphatase